MKRRILIVLCAAWLAPAVALAPTSEPPQNPGAPVAEAEAETPAVESSEALAVASAEAQAVVTSQPQAEAVRPAQAEPTTEAPSPAPASDAGAPAQAPTQPSPGASPAASPELVVAVSAPERDGLEPEIYVYKSGTRRDPFVPLVKAEPAQAGEDENRRPGVGDIVITGIVWGGEGRLALAETFWGAGLLLHEGDKLRDGRVIRITPEGVTLRQHGFGVSRTITLTIGAGEETGNER